MKKIRIPRLLLVIVTFGGSVVLVERGLAQEVGEPFVIGETLEIHSQILNEARRLVIATPESYETGEERYPVLYLLDGYAHFHQTTSIVNFLARNDRMPEVLVVAIPNTDRTRDLTPPSQAEDDAEHFPTHGGADNFLRFLSDELMPWVEQNYRTRPYKILVGHSFGGLFAIHALTTRPDVFNAYIAISPVLQWNDQRLVAQAETLFEATPELDADLFMTVGNEGGAMLGGARKLSGVLGEKAPRGFRWGFRLMEEETHGTVPLRSTRQGLESIFDGWSLHDAMTVYDWGGLTAIDEYYRKGGARFGYERTTPAATVMDLTFRLIEAERHDEAADVLMRDPETYPANSTFLYMLAGTYADRGDEERAREYYTLSLKANPGNENAKRKLTEMGIDVAALVPDVIVAAKILATYAGRYEVSAPPNILTIRHEDGQLTAHGLGIPQWTLVPVSQREFVSKEIEARFSFNTNAAGEVHSVTLEVSGMRPRIGLRSSR